VAPRISTVFAGFQPPAHHQAVVGGFVVAQQAAGFVERELVGQPDRGGIRHHRVRGKAALRLVGAARARADLQAVHQHPVARLDLRRVHRRTGGQHHAGVFHAGGVGRLGHVLVLAAGHQQIDPAHGGAVDADEDFVGLQARRGRPLHGLERQVVFHGVHGVVGECADDDFVALGHVQSCG
jgi:hypothetical protein